ncbi:MAG: hypothetical protein QM611_05325 [Microbacterium sp.]|uniref:hypothetical protein n=1 Tax=Microbacterium sp. TaxID=51671 RepID=UPI0039E55231
MTARRQSRRTLLLLIVGGGVVVIAIVVIAVTLALNGAKPPASAASTPTASQTPADAPPSKAELKTLQSALHSGDVSKVAPYLDADASAIDPEFIANVAALGITFDSAAAKQVAPGIFEQTAHDKGGNAWRIALQHQGDRLLLVYAEPA